MQDITRELIDEAIKIKQKILTDEALLAAITQGASMCIETLRSGGRIMLCGNGGSAADAQHIAAELSGRFKRDRQPLDCTALHVNTSYLTAVANDYGYDKVFARMLQARARKGDVLIALSTSGNSENIVQALEMAKRLHVSTIGMTGQLGGKMKALCDLLINVPSQDTARIQECHIMLGHIICQHVEEAF